MGLIELGILLVVILLGLSFSTSRKGREKWGTQLLGAVGEQQIPRFARNDNA